MLLIDGEMKVAFVVSSVTFRLEHVDVSGNQRFIEFVEDDEDMQFGTFKVGINDAFPG